MDETKKKELAYSRERTETAALGNPPEATTTAETSEAEKTGQSSKQMQETPMAALRKITGTSGNSLLADFTEYLKQTWRVWLKVTGAVCGLLVMVTVVKDVAAWAKDARERREEQAVASVTPERLMARCVQPAEDVTKEVYPILMRTMNYQSKAEGKLVFAFSRTAEEKSDWVFLSMKDEIETRTYDTPEAKIAALPCLDSKK
jgi:hypothetical protein